MVGLAGQVGRTLVVLFFGLEFRVAKITPEHREQAQTVRVFQHFRNLHYLAL